MKKVRIIKRTTPDDIVKYVIQQKHFLFRWWWVDAWVNSFPSSCEDTFDSLVFAKRNLWRFNGTKNKEKVVYHG